MGREEDARERQWRARQQRGGKDDREDSKKIHSL
jgi:hypothetical protein